MACSIFLSQENGSALTINYEFYEKNMNSKFVILEKSAMEYSSKLSILSNDVCRRLFKDDILDKFSTTILRSGYDISQTLHILISGIRAFNGRVLRAKQSGRSLHRSAESSLGERLKKKILGKTSWYKGARKTHKKLKTQNYKSSAPPKIKLLLFVPRTG